MRSGTDTARAAAPPLAGPPLAGLPRVILPLAILLLAGLLLAGCGGGAADGAIVVTDGAGRTVRLERPATRVISMMPAINEWILALGAGDRIVARTDYDDDPALDTLPSIGGGLTPSIEWLVARRPDLVVAWPDAPSRSIVGRLEALGVPVYTAPIQTLEQALGVAADLGALLGHEAAADSVIGEVRAGLGRLRAAVADRPRPAVLYLIGLDPLMAAGPGTFVDEMLRAAGGRNALDGVGAMWPQIALEDVVRRAPAVVVVGSTVPDPLARLRDRPGWRDVPAVRDGRVHAVDPNAFNRPGPRLHEAAAELARLLHR